MKTAVQMQFDSVLAINDALLEYNRLKLPLASLANYDKAAATLRTLLVEYCRKNNLNEYIFWQIVGEGLFTNKYPNPRIKASTSISFWPDVLTKETELFGPNNSKRITIRFTNLSDGSIKTIEYI